MARLTFSEAAVRAGVTDRTIRRWVAEGSLVAVETPDGRGGSERLIEETDLLRRLSRTRPDTAGYVHVVPDISADEGIAPDGAADVVSTDVQDRLQGIVDTAVQRALAQALADARERDQAHAAQLERVTREMGQQIADTERRAALAEAEAGRLRTELDALRTRTDADGRGWLRRLLGLD